MRIDDACRRLAVAAVVLLVGGSAAVPFASPRAVRLYVFDCGTLRTEDPKMFSLKREEVATPYMAVACYLIVHPKGTLIWDTGVLPDAVPSSNPVVEKAARTLKSQLAEVGYAPSDITYLALSHYHSDHTANANDYASATWLVTQVERDAMFAEKLPGPPSPNPSHYSALKNSKTVIIPAGHDHDVFADGTVVIKPTPGHTPGHQALFVRLAKTGGVVLSGDLWHHPEERALKRVPGIEFDQQQTITSREMLEVFLKQTSSKLWIQHDYMGFAKLRKAPQHYE